MSKILLLGMKRYIDNVSSEFLLKKKILRKSLDIFI